MAKKRTTPTSSSKRLSKTEAPKRVTAPAAAAVEAPPVIVDVAPVVLETPVAETPALDHWTIARRAFAKFAARGYVHGYHVQDWLEAEAELRA